MKRPRPLHGFKDYVRRRRQPPIQNVVRETSSGGIIFRKNPKDGKLEILLVQDARDRWSIPKGHVEKGESTRETALREVREETGLNNVDVKEWLGKTQYRFRRGQSLVLMVTHAYLMFAKDPEEKLVPEDWMNGIRWFPANEAVEVTAYDEIGKLMLLGMKKIRDARS